MTERKYAVELTIWEGSGTVHRLCVCDEYINALLIKILLEKVIPPQYNITRGNKETLSQRYEIKVKPLFEDES